MLRKGPSFRVYVRWLRGQMARTRRGVNPSFDDPESFYVTRDLYLTMGRDAVGGPVTVLIVRLGARFYVLDDTSGSPFTTDRRPEFCVWGDTDAHKRN